MPSLASTTMPHPEPDNGPVRPLGSIRCAGCQKGGIPLLVCDDPSLIQTSSNGIPQKPRFCHQCMIGKKVRVFWPVDSSWYTGVVQQYDPDTGEHLLKYDDDDTEWVKIGESGSAGPSASGGHGRAGSPPEDRVSPISPGRPNIDHGMKGDNSPVPHPQVMHSYPPNDPHSGSPDLKWQGPPHGPPVRGGHQQPYPPYGQAPGSGPLPPPQGMYPPGSMPYPNMPHGPYHGYPGQHGPYPGGPPPSYAYPPMMPMPPSGGPPGQGPPGKRITDPNGSPTSSDRGSKRKVGPKVWTKDEDLMLLSLVQNMRMPMKWSVVAQSMPERTGKQCRERYVNHLNPRLKVADWNPVEDATIFHLYNTSGSHWAKMSKMIPGRTDNGIKNRFHNLRRQLEREDEHRLRLSKAEDFPDEIRLDRLRPLPDHLRGRSDTLWNISRGIGVLAAQSVLGGGIARNAGRFGPFLTPENGQLCVRCGLFVPSVQCGREVCTKTGWCQSCTRIPPHVSGNLLRECLNVRRCETKEDADIIESWDGSFGVKGENEENSSKDPAAMESG